MTAMARAPVEVDTEVVIRHDPGASVADGADFSVGSVVVPAGGFSAATTLTLLDDAPEAADGEPEALVLYAVAGGESTNALTFGVWDAAVPALPWAARAIPAVLLVAAVRHRLRCGPAA